MVKYVQAESGRNHSKLCSILIVYYQFWNIGDTLIPDEVDKIVHLNIKNILGLQNFKEITGSYVKSGYCINSFGILVTH